MSPDEPPIKTRILNEFRTDLWALLKQEGRKHGRSAPRQMEAILAERYDIDNLSPEVVQEAIRQAKEPKGPRAEKRARKGTKKVVNGR